MRHLEESLESQLLERSTHLLSLTGSGRICYRMCVEALDLLEERRERPRM